MDWEEDDYSDFRAEEGLFKGTIIGLQFLLERYNVIYKIFIGLEFQGRFNVLFKKKYWNVC